MQTLPLSSSCLVVQEFASHLVADCSICQQIKEITQLQLHASPNLQHSHQAATGCRGGPSCAWVNGLP